jgi:SAM-dependent methyltransferase
MYEQEELHWWFQSRQCITETLLKEHILDLYPAKNPRLLDIGCGTGMFLQNHRDNCQGFGLDYSSDALAFCISRNLTRLFRGDAASLPCPDASFDIVTAFDLIEHVQDDHTLINEIRRVLKPGGFLLASVPAYPMLWTGHDVSLHHFRRYRKNTLESLFDDQDWDTIRMTSGFFLIFPLAAAFRLGKSLFRPGHRPSSDTFAVPRWLNHLLCLVHRVEAAWLKHFDLPLGTSYMTIRRKKS